MNKLFICLAAVCLTCAACNSPSSRMNAPPHGVAAETSDMQGLYVYMADNALLADMTVSDVHFYPHRPLLNTLGKQRLSRLASLMHVYGGEIRFSTDLEDDELLDARTEAIITFLAEAGIDTAADVLERGLPGGRGMDAAEVILIKANEGTYRPGSSSGSGSSGSASGPGF